MGFFWGTSPPPTDMRDLYVILLVFDGMGLTIVLLL